MTPQKIASNPQPPLFFHPHQIDSSTLLSRQKHIPSYIYRARFHRRERARRPENCTGHRRERTAAAHASESRFRWRAIFSPIGAETTTAAAAAARELRASGSLLLVCIVPGLCGVMQPHEFALVLSTFSCNFCVGFFFLVR